MLFCGLPGGSPGPGAIGTVGMLIFVALLSSGVGGFMVWLMLYAQRWSEGQWM